MNKYIYITLSIFALYSCGESKVEDTAKKEATVKTTAVSVIKLKPELFEHFFEVQGAISAQKNVLVTPEVGGLIKSLRVKEGQTIKKGAVIATFDSKVVNSNIKELEEQLDLAKYMYEKQQSLFDKGVGTEIALKQAEGRYKTLQQTIVSLNAQKGKFVLLAPFSGYVEEVYPVLGQMASPASPIIRLIDLRKLSVKADISESYLARISKSSKATLIFPALGNEIIDDLSIKRVGKFIDPKNRTVSIEVEIPKPSSHHVPNLMSVIKIRDYYDAEAIAVPSRVILRDVDQNPYLYTYHDGVVHKTYIEIGLSSGDRTQVASGLETTDTVVDRGCRGIKDGQSVIVK